MKAKTTRRAFLTSVLALTLCITMLAGTTYAWFTDSVTSGKNTIISGNLDVALEYYDEASDKYADVTNTTKLFSDTALWEPGYAEVAYLKVSNVGSLALRYQFNVNVYSETPGKTADGKDIYLSEYLKFKVVESESDLVGAYGDRQSAVDANAIATKLQSVSTDIKSLEKKGDYDYIALIIYMPEEIGNEANHDGTNIPSIEMGVTLYATQLDYENDSFGNDYDEGLIPGAAYVRDIAALRDAFAEGGTVVVEDDIAIDDNDELVNAFPGYSSDYPAGVQIVKDTDIILGDYDFAYIGTKDLYYLIHVTGGATVNIYGNSESVLSSTDPAGTNAIAANRDSVVNIFGGTFTSKDISVIDLNSGAVVNVYGGFYYAESYRGNGTQTNMLLNTTNNSTSTFNCYGGTYVNFNPETAQDGNYVPEGYEVIATTQDNGEIWYTVVPEALKDYTPAFDAKDLQDAFATGEEKVFIATDIIVETPTETLMRAPAGSTMTVDGNGNTIITNGVGTEAGVSNDFGYVGFIPADGDDIIVNNIKVTGSGFVEVGHHGESDKGNYTINNLTVEELVATLNIENCGNYIAAAFSHYGYATMNDCTITGTTTKKDGFKAYDAAFVNGTKTTINGGTYGTVYLANQAHVTVNDAEIDVIDSYAIKASKLGSLTIGAGAKIGVINLYDHSAKYTSALLVIEEGAEIGEINYRGVTYTLEEWLAAYPQA